MFVVYFLRSSFTNCPVLCCVVMSCPQDCRIRWLLFHSSSPNPPTHPVGFHFPQLAPPPASRVAGIQKSLAPIKLAHLLQRLENSWDLTLISFASVCCTNFASLIALPCLNWLIHASLLEIDLKQPTSKWKRALFLPSPTLKDLS